MVGLCLSVILTKVDSRDRASGERYRRTLPLVSLFHTLSMTSHSDGDHTPARCLRSINVCVSRSFSLQFAPVSGSSSRLHFFRTVSIRNTITSFNSNETSRRTESQCMKSDGSQHSTTLEDTIQVGHHEWIPGALIMT